MGGSALDAVTASKGNAPKGLTTFGLSFQWAAFNKQLSGSGSVASSGTNRLDSTLFDLSLARHLGGGFAVSMRLPIGSVRLEPTGGQTTNISGFGDFDVGGSYTFDAPFGGVWRPRLRARGTLVLPTGTAIRVEDASPGVPPNLIAIGAGAIGLGADIGGVQPITAKLSARVGIGVRAPLTYGVTNNRFGYSITTSIGSLYQPASNFLIAAGVSGLHRSNARNRELGTLTNSGGDSLGADLTVTYLASDDIAVGVGGQLPLYQNVNGTQVAQSFSLLSFVAMSFGSGDDDGHVHGGGGGGRGDGDGHVHGGEQNHDDGHDHSNEQEPDGGDAPDSKHTNTDRKDAGALQPSTHTPDIANLATGGDSFALAAAAVPGKIVAVDFWATWCKPCKQIEATLRHHASLHADFAVRQVEVPNSRSAASREHLGGRPALPTVWLLDRQGRVVRKLEGVSNAALLRVLDELQ